MSHRLIAFCLLWSYMVLWFKDNHCFRSQLKVWLDTVTFVHSIPFKLINRLLSILIRVHPFAILKMNSIGCFSYSKIGWTSMPCCTACLFGHLYFVYFAFQTVQKTLYSHLASVSSDLSSSLGIYTSLIYPTFFSSYVLKTSVQIWFILNERNLFLSFVVGSVRSSSVLVRIWERFWDRFSACPSTEAFSFCLVTKLHMMGLYLLI